MSKLLIGRRRQRLGLACAALVAAAAVAFVPSDARACGGCFVGPQPVDSTVVTGHRMLLSISTKETTLYDQIAYAGNPSSFAWVLPIRGKANIGISADVVFQTLDTRTRTQVLPPPTNCPPPPSCPSRGIPPGAAMGAASDAGTSVTVLAEETVGPYETVQLSATNANALTDWLTSRGYQIPTEIEPLIASYVSEGFDFLALKLVPGAGVSAMRPVRVTTDGAQPSLPLRMVAAGTGVSVGITLWVIGDGRWEPQSFPSFSLPASELTWDWNKSSSNIADKRAQKTNELGGSAWEIESSIQLTADVVRYPIEYGSGYSRLPDGGYGPISPYDPVLDDAGTVVKTSEAVAAEDMAALFQGRSSARITRMASSLPRASLATDLTLQAASDRSELSNFRQLTNEIGEPQCPVFNGCDPDGTAPRSEAQARAQDNWGGSCACDVVGGSSSRAASGGSLAAMLGLAMLAKMRGRRSRR